VSAEGRKPTGNGKGGREGSGRDPAFSVIDRRPRLRDDVQPGPERGLPTYVEELKTRTEEAEKRAREISAAYRRIDEERDAFRERLTRDLERRVDMARADLMRKVLDVLDDLDRAIAAAAGTADPTTFLAGVTMIRDRVSQVLASEGVQAIQTVGQCFDPATAEAVAVETTADAGQDNLVLAETAKGYVLGGTLLRPARVKVARHQSPATGTREDDHRAPSSDREAPRAAAPSRQDLQDR